jgi:hypothetical protein
VFFLKTTKLPTKTRTTQLPALPEEEPSTKLENGKSVPPLAFKPHGAEIIILEMDKVLLNQTPSMPLSLLREKKLVSRTTTATVSFDFDTTFQPMILVKMETTQIPDLSMLLAMLLLLLSFKIS